MNNYEIDFLPVGDGKDSGDAIAFRFWRPQAGAWAHVIVDAGFEKNGEALVEHVKRYYGTSTIELAILTHPDGDHIGGMGKVLRGLEVKELWIHDLSAHGGSTLPAAGAVDELITLANERGTVVAQPWAGSTRFDGALTILGPDVEYYKELVADQVDGKSVAHGAGAKVLASVRGLWERVTGALGVEVPFAAKEVSPRNNSSIITHVCVDGKQWLFTADAGEPAISRAWDFAESIGLAERPDFVQIPHHGSRRNASSEILDRVLGKTGQAEDCVAFVSCVADSEKHPSGRVVNAYKRRGYKVVPTAGYTICHSNGSSRGWGPAPTLDPMLEEAD